MGTSLLGHESKKNKEGQMAVASPRIWQFLTIIFAVLSVGLAIALALVAVEWQSQKVKVCSQLDQLLNEPGEANAGNPSPFDILTAKELEKVRDFMLSKTELNLVQKGEANLTSNRIYLIDSPLPDKSDVLAYMDRKQKLPTRAARVIAVMGAETPPVVNEYLVSPIPNPTKYQLINNPIQPNPLNYSARPDYLSTDSKFLDALVKQISEELYPVLFESYGYWLHNCTDHCLHYNYGAINLDQGGRFTFAWFFRYYLDGYYLWPVNFVLIFHNEGNDLSKFGVKWIYYENQKFNSSSQLLEMYLAGQVHKRNYSVPVDSPTYGSPNRNIPPTQSTKRPPQQIQLDGQRFTVKGHHVQFLDWSFDVRMRTVTGIHLLDVRHKNERIAYEIGTNDIAVYYSGPTPFNVFCNFLDAGWLIGTLHTSLIKGYDCPKHAVFLDHTYYSTGSSKPITIPNAVCVFEYNNGVPLRRHFSIDLFALGEKPFHYKFSMPDSVLVVRSIPTIWNYDYVIDFVFHQNGVIELRLSSTGYVQSFPYHPDSDNEKYGFTIKKEYNVMANLHHHMFNFKFDLDIGGVQNRFATWDIEVENKTHPFQDGLRWYQKYIKEQMRSTEMEALVDYNFDKPKYYVIYNNEKRNSEGHNRAYRIYSGSFSKMMLPKGWQAENAVSWARHQVAVTRHHDYEDTTATPYNQVEANDPVRKFERFYSDNESIVDEDLVVWATVGMHHIPVMEDVAVTTTAGKQLSVVLAPLNYFDDDPSMYSNDAVVIRPDTDAVNNNP